jgi:2-oxo-4-hydroxy-4-carboxy-5-ureidoimidazoline decarboxylase
MMTIAQINRLASLVGNFADIAEHAPWVAERAEKDRPFADREAMIASFQNAVKTADRPAQLELIRAHPDLAGKAKLTEDSASEQKGAGLDRLNAQEMARFNDLNGLYRRSYHFPFIFAVKGADKHQILQNFEDRLKNSQETEFLTALEMICRIIRFRLEDRVEK